MTNPTDDFDAISAAIESGDLAELDKLMEEQEKTEQEQEPEAENTDSADDGVSEDTADDSNESDESEDSPTDEVENGEHSEKDKEEVSTEAAVTAASTDSPTEREKELQKELQRYKSDAGRVPFVQKRLSELERELRAYKAREAQTTQSVNGKINATDVVLDEDTQREIDSLRETDPVMAKLFEKVAKTAIATARHNTDQVVTTLTQAEQEDEDYRFLMEQKQILLSEIPKADEIFATPQWKQWKDTLSPGQRAMAESSYASDVRQAVYAFAAAMQSLQAPAPTPVAAAPAAKVSTEASEKVKEARERKVAGSAEVKSSSPKKSVELDEEAFFREAYESIGKASHIL